MNEQLLLNSIRSVLARLEETIIFGLIERAQFRLNRAIYEQGKFQGVLQGECLVDYLLHETERIHAKMRRYTSPDEHPFFDDLPNPILPALQFDENPLRRNGININRQIRDVYEMHIVPHICAPGDDHQYGSSSVSDVHCLQALSKRIHYGKFVAESKFRTEPDRFRLLVRARDAEGIMAAVTDTEVEAGVLERVRRKSQAYAAALAGNPGEPEFTPEVVVDIYARWIIPMNKQVQVAYFLDAIDPASSGNSFACGG